MNSDPVLPKKLQIEICDICNIACEYCDVHEAKNTLGFMDLEIFKKIVDQAPYVSHIYPQFWGEPTLHPNFEEILEYCKLKDKTVSFYTNATNLHKKDINRILRNTDQINISIQSINPDHYRLVSHNDLFNTVYNNVINLWEMNSILDYPCIMVIRATDLNYSHDEKEQFQNTWAPFCHKIIWKPLRVLNKGYSPFSMAPRFDCGMLSEHCIIKCDGRMILCCTDHFGEITIGNVFDSSIIKLVNSDFANNLRDKIGTLEPCKNCWYMYKIE